MESLKAVGVWRKYGEQEVLKGLDLTLAAGAFEALMGPSGCGKSTFLHLAAGLLAADGGTIEIGGSDITKMGDTAATKFRRRHVGVVFQAFNLISTLTAEENIMLPILAGYQDKDISSAKLQKGLDELLERLQLTNRRHHYPDALSGGEQQRVAIARALLLDFATDTHGSLLLADEPTGNLDSANGDIICRLLRQLCDERHHTMVVVTHEPSVAAWTDRIVTLKDGTILSDIPNTKPGT